MASRLVAFEPNDRGLDVGVLLMSATASSGTSTFVSG